MESYEQLKIMEPRPIVFKEWRDTRTFSNLKSTHCTLLISLIINLVTKKELMKIKLVDFGYWLNNTEYHLI
jgi:hypothetical protein